MLPSLDYLVSEEQEFLRNFDPLLARYAQGWQPIVLAIRPALLDNEVLAFDPAKLA